MVTVTVNEVPKPNNFLSENEKLLQRIQAGEVQAQALRMLQEAERMRKMEQVRVEREQKQLMVMEAKRRKQEEAQRQKQEDALRRMQEKEAKRQQAAIVREQVRTACASLGRVGLGGMRNDLFSSALVSLLFSKVHLTGRRVTFTSRIWYVNCVVENQ